MRRFWPILLAALAACGHAPPSLPANFLSETVAGGWRRTSLREAPLSEAPEGVPHGRIRRIRVAAYEGPGRLEVRAYETDPRAGLEVIQHWGPAADTVLLYDQKHFGCVVAVHWFSAGREGLQDFVRDLEGRLARPGE